MKMIKVMSKKLVRKTIDMLQDLAEESYEYEEEETDSESKDDNVKVSENEEKEEEKGD
jgi:hypothetical protein